MLVEPVQESFMTGSELKKKQKLTERHGKQHQMDFDIDVMPFSFLISRVKIKKAVVLIRTEQ